MTMQLHKEVDHKNPAPIQILHLFLNRRTRLIGEKMYPMLRRTSSKATLPTSLYLSARLAQSGALMTR